MVSRSGWRTVSPALQLMMSPPPQKNCLSFNCIKIGSLISDRMTADAERRFRFNKLPLPRFKFEQRQACNINRLSGRERFQTSLR